MEIFDQHSLESPKHASTPVHSSANRAPMTYPRKRAVAACLRCRARKTKCDNQRPSCGFCASVGAECQYEGVSAHSSFDPASLHMIGCLNQIMKSQEDILARLHRNESNKTHSPPRRALSHILESSPDALIAKNTRASAIPHPSWESSANYLKIPLSQTTPDTLLSWPIFEALYPSNCFHTAIFESDDYSVAIGDDDSEMFLSDHYLPAARAATADFDEADIPRLTNRFLSLVHTKNPILDERTLRTMASTAADEGLRWNGPSCLVLLACALGSIAVPFSVARSQATMNPHAFRLLPPIVNQPNRERAESLYLLARRRIGISTHPIIASQCHFLSGVYLMYALRPVDAFQEFHQASVKFNMYLISTSSLSKSDRVRKLEQRLYWSCFKSECEILSEIPLPESGIADIAFPDMFPTPPDFNGPIDSPTSVSATTDYESPSSARLSDSITMQREQEHSWFYYLSEIALRRIGNRVLNTFYREKNFQWVDMDVQEAIKLAEEFMLLLQRWYEGLPPFLSYNQGYPNDLPMEELSFMIRARMLEIKSWIFRPFLFYAVHRGPDDIQQAIVKPLVDQAIVHNIRLIESSSIRHQHHGIWYTCRVSASAALAILAAVRSGHIQVPLGWEDSIQLAIETLVVWEPNAPGDLRKARTVLSDLLCRSIGEESARALAGQPRETL